MSRIHEISSFVLSVPAADLGGFVGATADKLIAAGIPIWRLSMSIPAMHPEIATMRVHWTPETGGRASEAERAVLMTSFYMASPVAAVVDGGVDRIRCRLVPPPEKFPYPICRDLAEQGATDYVAWPLLFTDGSRTAITIASRAEGGFSDADIADLEALLPTLSARIEIFSLRTAKKSLLEVYLGPNASRRVLAGQFVRGKGTSIHAAVWTCDLRGFTSLSDQRPPIEVTATLDAYFERVVNAVVANGGEVLKFIGDAVLAIFPVENDRADACARALAAARGAVAAVSAWNAERDAPLGMGIGLHVGEVFYGNIGGARRLDFTVIGAAVNEACRLEPLCKSLDVPIVMSGAFRESVRADDIVDFGEHSLRGVGARQRVYGIR